MSSNNKSRKNESKNKNNNKICLLKKLKDSHCNHIFFYEKQLNSKSVNKLRDLLRPYRYKTGFTLDANPSGIKSNIRPIVLHLHCPGGDIDSGFEAMKLIYKSDIPIITVVDGVLASAATFMCIVADLRLIYPHGHMLIHQPSNFTTSKGKFNTIEDKYLRIKKYMSTLKKIYKKFSVLNEKKLSQLLAQDIYLDANTCKDFGLIDYIME